MAHGPWIGHHRPKDKASGVTATGPAKQNESIAGITSWPGPSIENRYNNSDGAGDDKYTTHLY